MHTNPLCPGCRSELEEISVAGRSDDLYLCPECARSWFAFELGKDLGEPFRGDDAPGHGGGD